MSTRELRRKVAALSKNKKETEINAFLGNMLTGEVQVTEDVTTLVYATVAFTGQIIKVRNYKLPNKFQLPVKIGYTNNSKIGQVISRWDGVYDDLDVADIPYHHHTWGQTENVSWIRKEQILELLPSASGGMIVHVNSGYYKINGSIYAFSDRDFDLTSYIPVSGANWVSVEIDATGTISYVTSTSRDNRALVTFTDLAVVANTRYRLFACKVYLGQTEVIQEVNDSDLFDPRFMGSGGPTFVLDWNDLVNVPTEFEPGPGSPYYPVRNAALTDPSATDDASAGFDTLSLWMNTTTGDIFVCKDPTNGAAVWETLGGGGGSGDLWWNFPGTIAVSDPAAIPMLITKDTSITAVYLYGLTPGSAGDSTFDIDLNGSGSIFGSALTLNYADADGWVSLVPSITDFVEGDVLTPSISAIATGAADFMMILQVASASGGGGGGGSATIPSSLYTIMRRTFR